MTIKVCIADDQESARAMLRRVLAECPDIVIVGEAGNGSTTVALCRETNPDIVLLDISMPGMNGVEAARIMATLPMPPKIVTLSMHDDAFLAAEILNAGAHAYLTKDCEPGEILRAIRTVMEGRTYLSAGIAGPVHRQLHPQEYRSEAGTTRKIRRDPLPPQSPGTPGFPAHDPWPFPQGDFRSHGNQPQDRRNPPLEPAQETRPSQDGGPHPPGDPGRAHRALAA